MHLFSGDGSALPPGAIVGVVFSVVFIVMAAIVSMVFILKRRKEPLEMSEGLVVNDEDGFANPGYDTMQYAASKEVQIESGDKDSDA